MIKKTHVISIREAINGFIEKNIYSSKHFIIYHVVSIAVNWLLLDDLNVISRLH